MNSPNYNFLIFWAAAWKTAWQKCLKLTNITMSFLMIYCKLLRLTNPNESFPLFTDVSNATKFTRISNRCITTWKNCIRRRTKFRSYAHNVQRGSTVTRNWEFTIRCTYRMIKKWFILALIARRSSQNRLMFKHTSDQFISWSGRICARIVGKTSAPKARLRNIKLSTPTLTLISAVSGEISHLSLIESVANFFVFDSPKKFKNLPRLKTHEDIHNNTQYICNICGISLNTKRTLKMHMVSFRCSIVPCVIF